VAASPATDLIDPTEPTATLTTLPPAVETWSDRTVGRIVDKTMDTETS
jgi:hypothetical protein